MEAALDEVIVRTDDFRTEERWPQYSPAVVELGVLSGLSFKLYTANQTAGALTYSPFSPTLLTGKPTRHGARRACRCKRWWGQPISSPARVDRPSRDRYRPKPSAPTVGTGAAKQESEGSSETFAVMQVLSR